MNTRKSSLQHVQIPDALCDDESCGFLDPLVYANVKRHMDNKTHTAFPSLDTVSELSDCDRRTASASLKRMRGKYLDWYVERNHRVYIFKQFRKGFEPFSPEFLNHGNLTPQEKAYIIRLQQYMFKDHESIGKISFPNRKLAELLRIPERTVRYYNQALTDKGYLTQIQTDKRDPETRLPVTELIFNMEALGQSVIWKLEENKKRVEKNDAKLEKVLRDYEILRRHCAAEEKRKTADSELRIVVD